MLKICRIQQIEKKYYQSYIHEGYIFCMLKCSCKAIKESCYAENAIKSTDHYVKRRAFSNKSDYSVDPACKSEVWVQKIDGVEIYHWNFTSLTNSSIENLTFLLEILVLSTGMCTVERELSKYCEPWMNILNSNNRYKWYMKHVFQNIQIEFYVAKNFTFLKLESTMRLAFYCQI